jgi:SOS-response transcriptional repressor LexA
MPSHVPCRPVFVPTATRHDKVSLSHAPPGDNENGTGHPPENRGLFVLIFGGNCHILYCMVEQNHGVIQIPVLGWIPAGPPVPIPQSNSAKYGAESMVNLSDNLLPKNVEVEKLFALEVKGDGLAGSQIRDGDILIMSRTNEARRGELLAIWISNAQESTLAYYENEGGRVCLRWDDPSLAPIYFNDPSVVVITGRVVSLIRRIE